MERRVHPRVKTNCPVDIVINSTQKPEIILQGRTIDISEGGICLEMEKPLSEFNSAPLLSKISLDPFPYQIESYVELLWNQPVHENHTFRYGAKFLNIPDNQRAYLKKILWLNEQFITENLDKIMRMIDSHAGLMKQKVSNLFIKDILPLLESFNKTESNQSGTIDQKRLNETLHSLVDKGNNVETFINSKIIGNEIKKTFRSILGDWIYQSEIMNHALKKPYGYPGDYELLEIIYNNKEISAGTAAYFDRFFLDNDYAAAVRNRKDIMRDILRTFISSNKSESNLEILNIASGSCREIRELIQEKIDYKGEINFTCIDFDDGSLSFSKEALKNTPKNIKVNFTKENILNFSSKPGDYIKLYNNKDIVYSIGIADYLPDRILKKLIQFCHNLLKPKGRLIIAFKDRDRNKHGPLPPGWYCDWEFVPRSKNTVLNLIEECELNVSNPEIIWENSNTIFFVTIKRQ